MSHSSKIKNKARLLRKEGNSLSVISNYLQISKSTASIWVRDVELGKSASEKIENRRVIAQQKAKITKQKKVRKRKDELEVIVKLSLSRLTFSKDVQKIICAILFWTEGSKSGSFVSFINSDPEMIKLFLYTLRNAFQIDELKLRGLVHLHEYHEKEEVENFWSNISEIPLSQFTKSYQKPNTGKRKREGYLGSFRIRYYDVRVAEELTSIYTMLPEFILTRKSKIGL